MRRKQFVSQFFRERPGGDANLRVKLPHIDQWNERRRQIARHYDEMLTGVAGVVTPHKAPYARHAYHQYTVRIVDGRRDAVHSRLAEAGIGAMIYYPVPVHRTEAYAHLGLHAGSLPVTESMAERVCSLPIFPGIEDWQIRAIGAAAAEVAHADDESPRSLVA